ncbi:MAG: Unknown protein [uncultured Thiotrichaceae bacterium]|uniref:Uncharacterized protein n=1 Tax=uncultured Thiotrichaceae bacterium TaxID=298394 RepID=A0A6S6TW10_9GAMM|nr:MAG: Unknown protein [uncultured Thiotrichaceae bacterium]
MDKLEAEDCLSVASSAGRKFIHADPSYSEKAKQYSAFAFFFSQAFADSF